MYNLLKPYAAFTSPKIALLDLHESNLKEEEILKRRPGRNSKRIVGPFVRERRLDSFASTRTRSLTIILGCQLQKLVQLA